MAHRSTGRIGANLIDQRHSFRELSGPNAACEAAQKSQSLSVET
jgi:hypothetical protein